MLNKGSGEDQVRDAGEGHGDGHAKPGCFTRYEASPSRDDGCRGGGAEDQGNEEDHPVS
jgi:hypothetical protein